MTLSATAPANLIVGSQFLGSTVTAGIGTTILTLAGNSNGLTGSQSFVNGNNVVTVTNSLSTSATVTVSSVPANLVVGSSLLGQTVTAVGATTITLSGSANQTLTGTIVVSYGGASVTGTQNLTLLGSGTGVGVGAETGTIAGPIAIGTGTLTKNGVGTWDLLSANDNSGATIVNAGTLIGTASPFSGSVTLSQTPVTTSALVTLSSVPSSLVVGSLLGNFGTVSSINSGTGVVTLTANVSSAFPSGTVVNYTDGGAFGYAATPPAMTINAGTAQLNGQSTATTTIAGVLTSTAGSLEVNGNAAAGATTMQFEASTANAASLARGTNGTLTVIPGAGGIFGVAGTYQNINGGAFSVTANTSSVIGINTTLSGNTTTTNNGLPVVINGIFAPWVVAQQSATNTAGDFVTFSNQTGNVSYLSALNASDYLTFSGTAVTGTTGTNVVAVTGTGTATAGNVSAYALKVDGGGTTGTLAITSGDTLVLGGQSGSITLAQATVTTSALVTLSSVPANLAIGSAVLGSTVTAINSGTGVITLAANANTAQTASTPVGYSIGAQAGLILDNNATISGGSIDFFRSGQAGDGLIQNNEAIIYVGGSGIGTISSNLIGNPEDFNAAAASLGLTKTGVGTLLLSGNNTLFGQTSVNQGTLEVANTSGVGNNFATTSALFNGVIGGTIIGTDLRVANGATFDVAGAGGGSNSNTVRVGSLAGDGTVLLENSSTLIIGDGATDTFSGQIVGGSGSTLIFNGSGTEVLGKPVRPQPRAPPVATLATARPSGPRGRQHARSLGR